MSTKTICTIVEAELNFAIGLIESLRPDADMATRNLQNTLIGLTGMAYSATISMILQAEQAIINTCTFQCIAEKWDQNETRAIVCKLLKECFPAKNFIYTKTGVLLANNPVIVREAKRNNQTTSEYISNMILKGDQLFTQYVCDMSLEDYLKMLTDWVTSYVSELVSDLYAYIYENATLRNLDKEIEKAMKAYWEVIRPIMNTLREVQSFINECPLLCDLAEGLTKKLTDYEDFKESTEAYMNAMECRNRAFDPSKASEGWIAMTNEYEECVNARGETIDNPFRWMKTLDSWVKGKLSQLQANLNALSEKNLKDCVSPISDEETMTRSRDGLSAVIFSDADFDGLDAKSEKRIRGVIDNMGKSGINMSPQSTKLSCDSRDTETKQEQTERLEKQSGVKPQSVPTPDVAPKAPSGTSTNIPATDAIEPKVTKTPTEKKDKKSDTKKPNSKDKKLKRKPRKGVR